MMVIGNMHGIFAALGYLDGCSCFLACWLFPTMMAITPLDTLVSGFHFHFLLLFSAVFTWDLSWIHRSCILYTYILMFFFFFWVFLLEFHCFFSQLEYMGITLER